MSHHSTGGNGYLTPGTGLWKCWNWLLPEASCAGAVTPCSPFYILLSDAHFQTKIIRNNQKKGNRKLIFLFHCMDENKMCGNELRYL